MRPLIRRVGHAILAVPLFWKILLANAVVVLAVAILRGFVHSTPGSVAALAVAGMSLSLLVNAVVLQLALVPLELLQHAASRVQEGDLDARAPESPLADPALRRLARTFNAALEGMAASRRRVRRILARSLSEDEAERRDVALALEDDAAQGLAGLLLRLRLLERHPDRGILAQLLEESIEEVAHALHVVRGYAGGRRPAVLEELGLVAALQADARRLREESDVAVGVVGADPTGLAPDIELSLYRVLREALENAAHHAAARSIRVRISNGGGAVAASIEDDGRGFDPVVAENGDGLGLADMRERTESMGGRFSLWSRPDHGTRVRVELPA